MHAVEIPKQLGCLAVSVMKAEAYRDHIRNKVPKAIVFCQTLDIKVWVEASKFAVFIAVTFCRECSDGLATGGFTYPDLNRPGQSKRSQVESPCSAFVRRCTLLNHMHDWNCSSRRQWTSALKRLGRCTILVFETSQATLAIASLHV